MQSTFQFVATVQDKIIIGPICATKEKAARGFKRLFKTTDVIDLISFKINDEI